MNQGHFHHLGRLDLGSSEDEAWLHVLVRRDDLPILNLLGDGEDLNQQSGQGSPGTAGLGYPAGSRGRCAHWGRASHGSGLTGCANARLTFSGTRVTGKPRKKSRILPVIVGGQQWLWRKMVVVNFSTRVTLNKYFQMLVLSFHSVLSLVDGKAAS